MIYLPGHGRDVLRGAEDCPAELQPLVWFAVTGAFFGQPKQARDWTMRSFLAAQGSPVGLDVPEDKATREALPRAAARLFAEPLNSLKGRRLDAAALNGLLVPDPVSDMLRWMDGALTPEADPLRFEAFAALAAKALEFDPRKRTRQDAAARLAKRNKGWSDVWDRFEAGNGIQENVVVLLAREEPADLITPPQAYPAENARRETALRNSLLAFSIKHPKRRRRRLSLSTMIMHGAVKHCGPSAVKPSWQRPFNTSRSSPRLRHCLPTTWQRWGPPTLTMDGGSMTRLSAPWTSHAQARTVTQ